MFAFNQFRQLMPYLLLGAGIGAFIHGFVPTEIISKIAGPDNPLAAGVRRHPQPNFFLLKIIRYRAAIFIYAHFHIYWISGKRVK